MRFRVVPACLAALLAASGMTAVQAQSIGVGTGDLTSQEEAVPLSEKDRAWVQDIAQHEAMLTVLADTVQEKAHSPRLKSLAQRLRDDQAIAERSLSNLANAYDIGIEVEPEEADAGEIDRLRSLNGREFEEQLLETLKTELSDYVKQLDDAANVIGASDPKSDYAMERVPIAEQLQAIAGEVTLVDPPRRVEPASDPSQPARALPSDTASPN